MNAGNAARKASDGKEYHGIIVNISQRDRSIFGSLEVIGTKRLLFGLLILHKVRVRENEIDELIKTVQANMVYKILFKKQEFYAHLYRNDELIIVYRERVFRVSTDRASWGEALEYGRRLGIVERQLDFIPNRFEDEEY